MTDSEWQDLAQKHGVKFIGMQTWRVGEDYVISFPLFNFPKNVCNGTSFSLKTGESMEQAVNRVKSMFGIKR